MESYLWLVPSLHSNECKLKLTVVDINDFKNEAITSKFSIRDKTGPNLTVITPKMDKIFKEYDIIEASVLAQDDYGLGLVELWYISSKGNEPSYISNESFKYDILRDTINFTVKIPEGMSNQAVFKFIGVDRFNNENEIFSEL